jgi:FkbH-like protein
VTNSSTSVRTTSEHHPFRFAVSASFTAEPLRQAVLFWGTHLKSDFEVRFAPYNQIHQTLLDPSSEFALNTHGVNVILLRLEDLGQSTEQMRGNVLHLLDDLRAAPERMHVPLIFCLCPSMRPSPDHSRLAAAIGSALDETPGIQYLPCEEIQRLYPVDEIHNPEGERLGRIPYSEAFYCAIATAVVRRTHALVRPPWKLIALDCDNTLWQGICGEDGPANVILDPPRRALHEAMLDQREAGVLLTMASKNNEDDVYETFRQHPEMPLALRHFVTWRLNWDTKAENLTSISEQLGLGTDSFIFIDDNPKECAELEQALPEVLTLALPADVGRIPHFLRHVWAFDRPVVTEEDRNRSAYYAQAAEFGNEVRRAGSLGDFMASLQLRVRMSELPADKIPRVAQMTQRTNQFNTTTIRRSESDIQNLLAAGYRIYTADVSDRFGDYGLVGVLIVRSERNSLYVDSMLLSCRALGRGVEHRMLSWLAANAAPAENVVVPYQRTAKNRPACQFLESITFGTRSATDDGFVLRLPVVELSELAWQPQTTETHVRPKPARPAHTVERSVDYACIANELSTVPQILEAMRRLNGHGQTYHTLTDTERRLAQIWAELLERPSVSRTDNFFDLGGHSLIAVLLLLRIRETFGIELSIDDVYSGSLTLADLAARIEAAQIGGIDPEEYATLLAEIENLTDDEARELLAKESYGQI